jgi:hypothetical protein
MEMLILFGGLFLIVVPVLAIWAFVRSGEIPKRLGQLTNRVIAQEDKRIGLVHHRGWS